VPSLTRRLCRFQSMKMDMNLAEFVHWTLLENRYLHVGQLQTAPGKAAAFACVACVGCSGPTQASACVGVDVSGATNGPYCSDAALTSDVLLDGKGVCVGGTDSAQTWA
jgi:hypothetical protein